MPIYSTSPHTNEEHTVNHPTSAAVQYIAQPASFRNTHTSPFTHTPVLHAPVQLVSTHSSTRHVPANLYYTVYIYYTQGTQLSNHSPGEPTILLLYMKKSYIKSDMIDI